MRKTWQGILSLLMILSIAFVPVNAMDVEATSTDATEITDMLGRELTVVNELRRIVVLNPADAEILVALGADELIVGRGEYVDYPANRMENIPTVGSGENLNLEEILALQPQLVVDTAMSFSPVEMERLEEAGIPVYVTDASTIAEVYEAIQGLAKLVNKEAEGEALIAEMQATFEEYTHLAKEATEEEHTIYYEISPLEFGLWTAGQGTFMDEIGQMLQVNNIFAEVEGWAEISPEQVLDLNPDYIVTTSMPADGFDPIDELLNRTGWQDVTAIDRQQVFQANADEFTRPGPRLTDAIESLYHFIYEE
ncbi:ABC transporter substrate-binding protein [Suicoccus acidiformans]|uniref:ABC transporter substrate-binding protein n=1 Tax=Suicoccus acidiformans TaxID=2036206 RepID=A0A347WJ20_9LACT|nr:ABC transporter substrate-binding protein [Suicoccus acidiformans]AXY25077.1 ABC transporter substrate-binding protein [Suicoccus acidiformans]